MAGKDEGSKPRKEKTKEKDKESTKPKEQTALAPVSDDTQTVAENQQAMLSLVAQLETGGVSGMDKNKKRPERKSATVSSLKSQSPLANLYNDRLNVWGEADDWDTQPIFGYPGPYGYTMPVMQLHMAYPYMPGAEPGDSWAIDDDDQDNTDDDVVTVDDLIADVEGPSQTEQDQKENEEEDLLTSYQARYDDEYGPDIKPK